ncbi:ABC transporter permease [Roseivirga pacifica]|uniref:ABC transporter permease n=1 Tax=Roseivirga pacifica TaxID=1267423 RepID=UPI00227A56D2|nr:ABC transporter permease [Roseivirga pacifica]
MSKAKEHIDSESNFPPSGETKRGTPPRLAEKLLLWFLKDELAEEVLGDLDEKFYSTSEKYSTRKAKRNYWYQVINYLRPFAFKSLRVKNLTTNIMIGHFLKISWRTLQRNKAFSSIKIVGFAIGIAACLLIALFIQHELSYDKHYEKQDQIYRLANQYADANDLGRWTNMQGPFKPVIEDHIPEIELVARTVFWKWADVGENHIRRAESKNNIFETGFFYSDPEILQILEIPMVYGDQKTALSAPNSLVISKSKADKFFPGENPVGKQMILNDRTFAPYTIGGVMEDLSTSTHLEGDFIMTLAEREFGPGTSGWCCMNYTFYLRTTPGADKAAIEKKLVDIRDTYVMDDLAKAGTTDLEEIKKYRSYFLQPIQNVYLNPEEIGDYQKHGPIELVWIFGAIAIVILILACLNFINLSTAKSIKRAKEIGLRKVVGSYRSSLIRQLLVESIFYSTLSVFLGMIIASIALPAFNQLAEKSLTIPWFSYWFLPLLLFIGIIIGFISGIYPALYLSRFSPIQALRGKADTKSKTSLIRNGMVVFQFTATIILIIGSMVLHKQFNHYMNQSLGYEKDQVINILGIGSILPKDRDILKDELLRIPSIESATIGDYLPVSGGRTTNASFWVDGKKGIEQGFEAATWRVDEDYLQTMGMEILQGRNITDQTRDTASIVINETMLKEFGLEDPIGARVVDMFDAKYTIVGVVKDFYFESLAGTVRPLAMQRGKGNSTLSVKVNTENFAQAIAGITATWNKIKPNQPIRYTFMNDRFRQMYDSLLRAKSIFIIFSVLSVVVACLGLFALSAFIIEQRSKEISVRKVLGANISRIFTLLTTDFIKLVLIAILIAIPIGWYLTRKILDDMANRITPSWSLFGVAALVALVIALFTISFESIRAARVNPAQKLRSE